MVEKISDKLNDKANAVATVPADQALPDDHDNEAASVTQALTLVEEPDTPDNDLLEQVQYDIHPVEEEALRDEWAPEDKKVISEYERRLAERQSQGPVFPDEEDTPKNRSIVFDDPAFETEAGFIAPKGENKESLKNLESDGPDGLSAAFPAAAAGAGLAAGALPNGAGLSGANGPAGSLGTAPGENGSSSGGGSFSGSYKNRWMLVRNPLAYRPITKWLDHRLKDLSNGQRDSNIVLIRHGIRRVPTHTSTLVSELLQKRAQQLSMKPSEARKSGFSKERLARIGQLRFSADREIVATMRKQEKAHKAAQAASPPPGSPGT